MSDEIVERLARIRPDWDWKRRTGPGPMQAARRWRSITDEGIYNRAVVLPGERSPFTQGLETELKALGERGRRALRGTALGQLAVWCGRHPGAPLRTTSRSSRCCR
jgi:hypothetical protein